MGVCDRGIIYCIELRPPKGGLLGCFCGKSFDFVLTMLYRHDKMNENRGKNRLEDNKMVVTATELKLNLGKYLSGVINEEVTISKNGKPIAKLVPYREYVSDSLVGVLSGVQLPDDFTGDYRELIREMREKDYENLD